jgi:cytochrome P450
LALARLEPPVRAFARKLVERLPLSQPVDWVESFAQPMPGSVMIEMLGLDPSLRALFMRWSDIMTTITDVSSDMTVPMEEVHATIGKAKQYMGELLAHRRREPGDDMVADLLRAQADGEPLTDAELRSFLFLVLIAGLETTGQLLNHLARVLIERPEVLTRVRADLSLVPRLVEEVLRYEPPSSALFRQVTEDVELSGVRLPKGAGALIILGSANRDEARFPDAERFDLDRGGVNNLPFGHGGNFCLGAPLVRLEAKLALEELLPRIRALSAAGPVEWKRSISIRGVQRLPLIVHPA